MKHRTHRAVTVVACLTVVAVLTTSTRVAAAPPSEVPFSPYPAFPGEISPETEAAAAAMAEAVENDREGATGVVIAGEKRVVITVPPGGDKVAVVRTARSAAARTSIAVNVEVTTVRASRAGLERLRQELEPLLVDPRYQGRITGIGSDPSLGVVVIYASAESAAMRAELKARYGDAIIFRQAEPITLDEADRDRDTAQHYAGAGYLRWNVSHTGFRDGWCSTSFPVTISGTRYQLTAGHCQPGQAVYRHLWASFDRDASTPASIYYFGTLHTTTVGGTEANRVDGTQDLYGDWALIGGSTYAPLVYNCANPTGACSALGVGAASWGIPVMNATACSSGRTTGQRCRMRVVDQDMSISISSLSTAHITLLHSNQDNDGARDCGAWRGGDSGGAIYQALAGAPNKVLAMGLVTGHGYVDANGNGQEDVTDLCNYYYTRLDGLRAWNSSVTMPTV